MTIDQISNANIPYTTSFVPNGMALTPETLLTYCSSRMEALDTNIKQYFAEQQKRNAAIADESKLLEIVQMWPGQASSDEIKGSAALQQGHADQANRVLDLYNATSSPEVKARCREEFAHITGLDIDTFSNSKQRVTSGTILAQANAGNIKGVTTQERDAQIQAIKDDQASMTKSSEMNMIQLQALVQQRQLAVQLTTQLMQTMHETSKQVLGNIR